MIKQSTSTSKNCSQLKEILRLKLLKEKEILVQAYASKVQSVTIEIPKEIDNLIFKEGIIEKDEKIASFETVAKGPGSVVSAAEKK